MTDEGRFRGGGRRAPPGGRTITTTPAETRIFAGRRAGLCHSRRAIAAGIPREFMLVAGVKFLSRFLFVLAALMGGGGDVAAQSAEWTRESVENIPAAPRLTHERQDWRRRGDGAEMIVEVVRFQAAQAGFQVVDQGADGDRSLADVMRATGALAGINGGYFHPDRKPLGLVVTHGVPIHAEERARLLSGVLLIDANGTIRLQRVDEPRAKMTVREALQAGPFLVDAGQPVAGLENKRAARRSVVATDGGGTWAILTLDHATLAEAAALLATPGVLGDGKKISRALNLDGGSSTGLWVKGAGTSSPTYAPEFGTVRNFLGVFPR